ncbi:MAG TPA: hypothetical protein VF311_00560 [Terriglobales bacterium]|jgi:hypothetical protein
MSFDGMKPMASIVRTPISMREESAEERFHRLMDESRELHIEAIGSPEEIKRDALATLKSWSKLRRRAKSV